MQYDFEQFFSKHSSHRTSALGRITRPFLISLVIMSGRVEFLSPAEYQTFTHVHTPTRDVISRVQKDFMATICT